MADMLTIGTVAANTFKKALDVTSHNVANVNTEGYSRQRAEISSNAPNIVGASFLGGGSKVDTVERISAEYIQRQLFTSQALVEKYDASLGLAKQVEGVIAGNDEGVKEFMLRFFDSLQEVAANPTSPVSRRLMLDESQSLESHLTNLSDVLQDIDEQTNTQIRGLMTEVNERLESIHAINEQVQKAFSVGSQPPNDLLDTRDQAILELSQYVDVQTYPQEDGSIEVYTATGRLPLISDNILTSLQAASSSYPDENRVEIYAYISGEQRVVSDRINGGQLGGVLDFRSEMLDEAKNDLGLTMNGLVASMNWQHYQGYDLNGDPGESLFLPLSADVLKNKNNQGASDGSDISVTFTPPVPASMASPQPQPPYVTQPATFGEKQALFEEAIGAIGNFTSREYELRFNSTTDQFDVFDKKTQEALGSFDRDGVTPVIIDGLEFKGDNGSYVQGDRFIVKPHQDILEDFEVILTDPEKIASRGQTPLADHYDATWDDDNDNSISYLEFFNNSGIASNSVADVDAFFAAATPAAANVGTVMDKNGDGVIGQTEFSLLYASLPNPAAYGDNTNMANMASLQSKEILLSDAGDEPSANLLGGYSVMAANVGLYVRSTDIQLSAQENVFAQVMERRESMSGVSLDEEAANLLKFQQAYEASAQIISTSQSLFQTLLSVVRG